ncbi:MAG: CvpA family protein [Candidatus Omnitrophica bacterium]|nr:CvpA family protein [Candidatus Omnitrophota bacterium]
MDELLTEVSTPTTWPNWVDLILVTLLLRTCYTGFGRGVLVELLHLVGIVGATIFACVFHGSVSRALASWVTVVGPALLDFGSFLALLALGLAVFVQFGVRALAKSVTGNRLAWSVQGLGLLVGGVRGLWWAGLALLVFLATGGAYVARSIQERSVLSPPLLAVSRTTLAQLVSWTVGSRSEGPLIPTLSPRR